MWATVQLARLLAPWVSTRQTVQAAAFQNVVAMTSCIYGLAVMVQAFHGAFYFPDEIDWDEAIETAISNLPEVYRPWIRPPTTPLQAGVFSVVTLACAVITWAIHRNRTT